MQAWLFNELNNNALFLEAKKIQGTDTLNNGIRFLCLSNFA